jgi:hypothetical protein
MEREQLMRMVVANVATIREVLADVEEPFEDHWDQLNERQRGWWGRLVAAAWDPDVTEEES